MRFPILLSIWLYRKYFKPRYHRTCFFKESCSYYVERITHEQGTVAGLQALWERLQNCRPGYSFYFSENEKKWELISWKGRHYDRSFLSSSVIAEGDALWKGLLSKKKHPNIFRKNALLTKYH